LEYYAPPNCLTDYDPETGQTVYDTSDNPLQCNAMLSTFNKTDILSIDYEPYIGKVCKGITPESIVTTPGEFVNKTYANLLPPYVGQTIIEDLLSDVFDMIPCSFKPACLKAMRIFFCSSANLPGVKMFLTTPPGNPIGVTTHVPMMPSRYLCEHFKGTCSKLVSLVPELQQLNCSERINLIAGPYSVMADRWATGNQTVVQFGPVSAETAPNNATGAEVEVVSACPRGFGVPEDFDAPGQILITGRYCE
jgi:hypothetical protein